MVRFCHRYGPEQLPHVGRNDIDSGIATAATRLSAVTLRLGAARLLIPVSAMSGTLGFVFNLGLLAVPVAVPTSFIVGALFWRQLRLDSDHQRYGTPFGGLTALRSFVAGKFGPAFLVGVSNVIRDEMALREAVVFTTLLLPVSMVFAVIAAGWLVVPLGAFSGWYHERAKARF